MNAKELYSQALKDYFEGGEAFRSAQTQKRIELENTYRKDSNASAHGMHWAADEIRKLCLRAGEAGVRLDQADQALKDAEANPQKLGRDWEATHQSQTSILNSTLKELEEAIISQERLESGREEVIAGRKGISADRLNFIVLGLSVASYVTVISVLNPVARLGFDALTVWLIFWCGAYATWSALRRGFLFGAMAHKEGRPKTKGVGYATSVNAGLIMIMTALVVGPTGGGDLSVNGLFFGALVGLGLLMPALIKLPKALKLKSEFIEYANYYYPKGKNEIPETYEDPLYEKLAAGASNVKNLIQKNSGPKNL